MSFKRHLEPLFIAALSKLYDDRNSWWHALVQDQDVFIAIRSNTINAYAGGASIARIGWNNGLQLRVHRKFLVVPKPRSGDDAYADLLRRDGLPVEAITVNNEVDYVEHLLAIKAAGRRLTGHERSGEIEIATSCPCVLDVEAAFDSAAPSDSPDDDIGSGGRVDIVAINDGGHVTLTEAKLYSNSEIRSKTEPIVCTQLVEYYTWARDHAPAIIRAYTDVQDYRRKLHLRLASESVDTAVDLDVIPRLIIFGFDSTQKSQIPGIKNKIVEGLRGRIPEFQETHIRAVGNPSNIGAHHLQ